MINESTVKQNRLIETQSLILQRIQKSYSWFFLYAYAGNWIVISFILFTLLTITRQGWMDPPNYFVSSFIFIIFGSLHLKSYYSFLRHSKKPLRHLRSLKVPEYSPKFLNGVNIYINEIYFLLYHTTSATKTDQPEISNKIAKDINRQLLVEENHRSEIKYSTSKKGEKTLLIYYELIERDFSKNY